MLRPICRHQPCHSHFFPVLKFDVKTKWSSWRESASLYVALITNDWLIENMHGHKGVPVFLLKWPLRVNSIITHRAWYIHHFLPLFCVCRWRSGFRTGGWSGGTQRSASCCRLEAAGSRLCPRAPTLILTWVMSGINHYIIRRGTWRMKWEVYTIHTHTLHRSLSAHN